jgi:hypothetical protein
MASFDLEIKTIKAVGITMRVPSFRFIGMVLCLQLLAAQMVFADTVRPLPYDLVYVRAAYKGATGAGNNTVWPDTVRPLTPEPGAQLMLLRSNGTRELLFPLAAHRGLIDTPSGSALSVGSVSDPNVSFDAKWVLFTWYHNVTSVNTQRDGVSYKGADLYKINLQTREVVRLTQQIFTPNTGNGASFDPGNTNSNYPRVGVFNTGGTFAPDGKIVFTSTRNNQLPPKSLNSGQRALQLFRMDDDGKNVEMIGHLNLAMALHPQILMDGRITFSSWEEHGIRDPRQFALWVMGPDGRSWSSLSGFSEFSIAHHFMTQMPGGDVVVTRYYNLNNNGFGDLIRFPLPGGSGPGTATPDPAPGSGVAPFEPIGQVKLTPFTTADDYPAPCPGRESDPYGSGDLDLCPTSSRRGKFTHPAAAPSAYGDAAKADLLAVYSPGPATHNGIYVSAGVTYPWYHGEIVALPDGQAIPTPSANIPGRPPELKTVLAEDGYNLQWPRPVVTYQQLYGIAEPAAWPELSDSQISAERLTPGEPFGLVGSSSMTWRDTEQARSPYGFITDRDPFNQTGEQLYRWLHQGADAGLYADNDVYAVRVLSQQSQTDRSYPDNVSGFYVVGGERMRILGEIPVRKPGSPSVLLPNGSSEVDTSFLAKIPADTSFTFQTIDRRGMVLNMAQTWHQVRPGEARYDCGGCHAHSKTPLDFSRTAAARPDFTITDLARTTPLLTVSAGGATSVNTLSVAETTVEYNRDIVPIFEARCASCHNATTPSAGLPLSASAARISRDGRQWPRAYYQLIRDSDAQLGPAPPAGTESYYLEPQLTHYVRAFQARQSLLAWKLWGARLDGRSNSDRTTDVDYQGSVSHPDGIGVAAMPNDEKLKITRWLELGAPIEFAQRWGFLEDDLRPTLVLRPSVTSANVSGYFSSLQISGFDTSSGINSASLSVVCDCTLGTVAAGSNLAAGRTLNAQGNILNLSLPRSVLLSENATFTVSVRDLAGNTTSIVRTYRAEVEQGGIFANDFE